MKRFIKVADNGYSYINTDLIVRIDYTPREHRFEEYKNDPVNITMSNGEYHKISNEDAEELIKNIVKTERERKMNKQRQEMIDTIIDIYNGEIKTYDEYLKIERDKTANAKTPYELFTEIISEETFDYIKSKGNKKSMAEETIRILRKKSTLSIDLKFATEEEKEIIYATLLGDENV